MQVRIEFNSRKVSERWNGKDRHRGICQVGQVQPITRLIKTAHFRRQLSNSAIRNRSSDRHTAKPWLWTPYFWFLYHLGLAWHKFGNVSTKFTPSFSGEIIDGLGPSQTFSNFYKDTWYPRSRGEARRGLVVGRPGQQVPKGGKVDDNINILRKQ